MLVSILSETCWKKGPSLSKIHAVRDLAYLFVSLQQIFPASVLQIVEDAIPKDLAQDDALLFVKFVSLVIVCTYTY